jgi:protein phosphatase
LALAHDPSNDDDDVTLVTRVHGEGASELASLLEEVIREAQQGVERQKSDPPVASHGQGPRAILLCESEAVEDEKTGPGARILISAQGDSDQGRKRKRNEDSLLFLPEQAVFAVADGMGGYEGGRVASSLAVESMRAALDQGAPACEIESDSTLPKRGRELACAVLEANRAVFEAARADPALARMGTTLVAARFALNKQRLYIGHVGDSRCYRLRDGQLRQLTTDHTMRQLGLAGPRANDLSRAVGMDLELSVDLLVDKPHVNDIYLLCSDGLSKMVSDTQIRDTLLLEEDLEAAVYCLIELANDAGGKDNITVVLVKVLEAPRAALPSSGFESRENWR